MTFNEFRKIIFEDIGASGALTLGTSVPALGISSDASTINGIRTVKHIGYIQDPKKKKKVVFANIQKGQKIRPKKYALNVPGEK